MSETSTGRLCWYELMTTKPEGAPSLYGEITGWGTQPFVGTVVRAPMDVPGGDIVAHCVDPDGSAFAVHAVASA